MRFECDLMVGSYPNLIVDSKGKVAIVRINRPEKLNALDDALMKNLGRAFSGIAGDKRYKAIVVSGDGGKAFCAGADIEHLSGLKSRKDIREFVDLTHSLMDRIAGIGKPVIAAIDGYCLGGGFELALACDIRIATSKSMFGLPEVKLGIIPGGGGTQRLPLLAGPSKAKELIFTGRIIGAKEALSIRLVDRVVSNGALGEAVSLADEICRNSGNSVRLAKAAINAGLTGQNFTAEADAFISAVLNRDSREGLRAFLERRRPEFD